MTSQSLKILDLSNNNIKRLEVAEQDFPSLQRLNLTGNKMTEIESIRHPSLTSLILLKKKLTKLPEP